mgnify:CR=1 FL=1
MNAMVADAESYLKEGHSQHYQLQQQPMDTTALNSSLYEVRAKSLTIKVPYIVEWYMIIYSKACSQPTTTATIDETT